jgi:hypothetical protein
VTKPKTGWTPEQVADHAEWHRQYRTTPEGRAAKAASQRRYNASEKGRAGRDKRRATAGYRAIAAERLRRFQYGLEPAEYEAMLVAQSGRCASCADPMISPQVDHCHKTGSVRELLCGLCNRAAGHLQDDASRCRALADYLERHAA